MAKKQTYADKAKSIMNKYKPRLGEKFDKGDTLALEAMNQELTALRDEQERERVQKLVNEANGEQLSQLSQALQQQPQGPQSQFRPQNNQGPQQPGIPQGGPSGLAGGQTGVQPQIAGQSRFATGGNLPRYQGPGINPNFLNAQDYISPLTPTPISYLNPQTGAFTNIPGAQQQAGGGVSYGNRSLLAKNQDFNALYAANQSPANLQANVPTSLGQYQDQASFGAYDDPSEFLASQGMTGRNALNAASAGLTSTNTGTDEGDDFTPFKSRVPYFGAVAQGLGSVLANRNIDFGELDRYTPQQVVPQTISLAREREQLKRDRDIAMAGIRGGQGTGGSKSKLQERLLAGATGTQRVLGRGASQSFQREAVTNAQIRNQAEQFNAQQRAIAQRLNLGQERENLLINEQRRAGRIGGVAGAITGYGRDLLAADQYDQMLQIMAPENYRFGQEKDSPFRRALQVSPTMGRFFNRGADPRLYQE